MDHRYEIREGRELVAEADRIGSVRLALRTLLEEGYGELTAVDTRTGIAVYSASLVNGRVSLRGTTLNHSLEV